jgi:protein phosphatase
MTVLHIPQLCLVVLVGTSGSGKSSFAARHFGRFEVISSDFCRGLVSDDENDQDATKAAFELLDVIVGKRLARGRLTVVDATNVQREARQHLVELAKAHDVLPVAIVLDVPPAVAVARNAERPDRDFGSHVIRRQHDQLRRSLKGLSREGFRHVQVLDTVEAIDAAEIVRDRLYSDFRDRHGPFDVIGDVHGCRAELEALLQLLDYRLVVDEQNRAVDAEHPDGRIAVFVGDLVDRGPDSPGVLRLVMGMTRAGHALAVPGNHENKLIRALDGRNVKVSHGMAETLTQLAGEPAEFRSQVRDWCYGLVSHLVLDDGKLVVAHAGLIEAYHGRASGRVRSFALYGDTTGETDEYGLPVRYPWAEEYRGRAMVLYGHTPIPDPVWVNNTLCLDTGCVFGGHLTALRYPAKELIQVAAQQVWYQPVKPLRPAEQPACARGDDELDITDVAGKRSVETGCHGRISIRAENAAGALEVMSRFALHPRWVPYLPPTMAPVGTCSGGEARDGILEHPDEAFDDYAGAGVDRVICEEKHMGSRAVVLLCRDTAVARRRFGSADGRTGAVYTRTGRSFLDSALTEVLLDRVRSAVTAVGLWDELDTDWLLLDAELLPWSLKAEGLLREQYASVGAAARVALPPAVAVLETAVARGLNVQELLRRMVSRVDNAEQFTAAYRRYCWPVDGLDGVQLAPFQLLATEKATWYRRDHLEHLALFDRLAAHDPVLVRATRRVVVDLESQQSRDAATAWCSDLTASGGEGMVVKPLANLVRTRRGLVQPGLKVRGQGYLRIIYGADYTLAENLARLKQRNLGVKRSLALREYALGLESLDRLVAAEPLWRVHEAVFAVLALESEPVDPRL